MKFNKTLVATACGLVAASAMAADVNLYGVLDYSGAFTNQGGSSTFTLNSGDRWGSRVGLKGTEDFGNGYAVNFQLEGGFSADTGAQSESGKLFNRISTLGVVTPVGEFRFGRAGVITGGCSNSVNFLDKYVAQGTSYGNFSADKLVGTDFYRVSNSVQYVSPKFGGATAAVQYSNGVETETGHRSDDYRFVAGVLDWDYNSVFSIAVGYDRLFVPKNGDDNHDTQRFYVGLNGKPFGQALTGHVAFVAMKDLHGHFGDVTIPHSVRYAKGNDGMMISVGADYVTGPHKVMVGYGFFDGDSKGSTVEVKAHQVGAAYNYSFSKRLTGYAAASWFKNTAKEAGVKVGGDTNKGQTQVMVGGTYLF